MPLYEYRCVECTSSFSELRSSNEMNLKIDCPECGSGKTKRFFSSFSVGTGTQGSNSVCSKSSSKFR